MKCLSSKRKWQKDEFKFHCEIKVSQKRVLMDDYDEDDVDFMID